jgi:hypothetical protein
MVDSLEFVVIQDVVSVPVLLVDALIPLGMSTQVMCWNDEALPHMMPFVGPGEEGYHADDAD